MVRMGSLQIVRLELVGGEDSDFWQHWGKPSFGLPRAGGIKENACILSKWYVMHVQVELGLYVYIYLHMYIIIHIHGIHILR